MIKYCKVNTSINKVKYVEQTIFNKEGVDVHFIKDGKDVRSNITDLKNKLSRQFPGYDFEVLDGYGNKVPFHL